jgi:hypothetical protein
LLKLSTRVYSSPKPTQPDSSTIGEANLRPQKLIASDPGSDGASAVEAVDVGFVAICGQGCTIGASMRGLSPIGPSIAPSIAPSID